MKYKVGDKVRIRSDLKVGDGIDCVTAIGDMLEYRNKIVTIKNIEEYSTINGAISYWVYDLDGGGNWSWTEEMFEPVEPQLGDIVSEKWTCVIHTPSKEDAICVVDEIPSLDDSTTRDEWLSYWDLYREDTCYSIVDGRINAYCEKRFYKERGDLIYEFSDIEAHSVIQNCIDNTQCSLEEMAEAGKAIKKHLSSRAFTLGDVVYHSTYGRGFITGFTAQKDSLPLYEVSLYSGAKIDVTEDSLTKIKFKEESPIMKNTFTAVDSQRLDKTCNQRIPTKHTIAWGCDGTCTVAVCDKSEYDAHTGALVAAAKITAHKTEEAMLMYNLAMNMWGTETSTAILKTLADRAMGGSFENVYKKWQKQIEQEEKKRYKDSITCSICGRWYNEGEDGTKYPFTPAEKEEHEKWHEANRKAKRIRYQERSEAKKRIAEAEREGRITEYIAEIVEARKRESDSND